MKKIVFIIAMLFGSVAFFNSNAQVSFSINIGSQPLWGPTGYDYAQFYYLPDIDAYYNVSNSQFVYNEGGRWINANSLPSRYRNYDLYNGYKVVVNDPNPWLRDNDYRRKYNSYKGHHGQAVIRDSRDEKYWAIKGHPHHSDWERNHRNDMNHGNNNNQHNNNSHNNGRHDDHNHGRR